jgi:hypothetical protein
MSQKDISLRHEFVEFIPNELEQGTIYISIRFATASHLCLCGCRNKVVTPIRPTDWKLIFDGKTVSFDPSIGNWSFPCQSHYWIRNNRVTWAPKWSSGQIERGRRGDHHAKERYFEGATSETTINTSITASGTAESKRNLWSTVKSWFAKSI